MVFVPTTWNSGAAPGISAAELNRIEAGIKNTDAGVNYRVDPNVADLPSTYQQYMTTISRARPDAPYNWPHWGSVITINPQPDYYVQLLFSVTSPEIMFRNQASNVWNAWRRIHTEGDPNAFTSSGNIHFVDGKIIHFVTPTGNSSVLLNSAATAYLGYNGSADVYLGGPNKVTFYQHGNGGNPLQIDWTMQVGLPVIRWPNNIGVKEVWYDSGGGVTQWYSMGISGSELWQRFSGYYKIYNFGDSVGSSVPQLEINTVNPVETAIINRGIPLVHRANGIYLGNNTNSRAITVGFRPTHVMIMAEDGTNIFMWEIILGDMSGITSLFHSQARNLQRAGATTNIYSMWTNPTGTPQWMIYITSTGFSVGGVGGGYLFNANSSAWWHTWIALG